MSESVTVELPPQCFSAAVNIDGVNIAITALNLGAFLRTLDQLGVRDNAAAAAEAVVTKAAAKPKEAVKADPKPEAVASAPAPAVPVASTTATPVAPSEEKEKRPDYNDIKKAVTALANKDRALAMATLGKFGVDHGNKLELDQYGPFLVAAAEALK